MESGFFLKKNKINLFLGNKYLLKTDDDSFIHLEALWDLAKSRLEKKSNHLIGYLQLGLKKHHYLPLAHKPTSGNLKKVSITFCKQTAAQM